MTKPSFQLHADITDAVRRVQALHADLQANDPTYWDRDKQAATAAGVNPYPFNLNQQPAQAPRIGVGDYLAAIPKVAKAMMTPADSEMAKRRLDICRGCDKWTGSTCTMCGCFTALKVRLSAEACPIGKWAAE